MKKGDTYYLGFFDYDSTPIVWVWKYKITCINKNGIYLTCQEKYLENDRTHLRSGVPKDRGFRLSATKARKVLLPEMKNSLHELETDEEYKEIYTDVEIAKKITNIKSAITKIKKL